MAVHRKEGEMSDSHGVCARGLSRRLVVGFRTSGAVPGRNKNDGIFVFNVRLVGRSLLTLMTVLKAECPAHKKILPHFNCKQIAFTPYDRARRRGPATYQP